MLHRANELSTPVTDSTKDNTGQSEDGVPDDAAKTVPRGGTKEGPDWQKVSHVILSHPFMCKLRFDASTARIGEILEVLCKYVPKRDLEKLSTPLIASAESKLTTIMSSSSIDEEHLEVVRSHFSSLAYLIPPPKCLTILRQLLAFLQQQINTAYASREVEAVSRDSRILSLLSIVECLLDRVPVNDLVESKTGSAMLDERTTPVEESVTSLDVRGFEFLTTDDIRDIMTVAKQAKAWTLLSVIGQLLHDHHDFVSMIEEDGLLSACLEANAEHHKQVNDFDILVDICN